MTFKTILSLLLASTFSYCSFGQSDEFTITKRDTVNNEVVFKQTIQAYASYEIEFSNGMGSIELKQIIGYKDSEPSITFAKVFYYNKISNEELVLKVEEESGKRVEYHFYIEDGEKKITLNVRGENPTEVTGTIFFSID